MLEETTLPELRKLAKYYGKIVMMENKFVEEDRIKHIEILNLLRCTILRKLLKTKKNDK